MIIAAPLLIPFAKAAGLTIAGLGAIEIGKKVQSFVDNNPEVSSEILTSLKDSLLMTLPGGMGLNTLFKKKASVTLEDVENMTDEEAADLSKEDKAEIMKEVGKSKGGDKRQRMIEISEKLGLSGEGKEKQTIIDEVEERYDEGGVEDAPKPKFDYKKFFRNRNADGGAIGIEVLFEEKKDGGRIGFANGGENIIGADLKEKESVFFPKGDFENIRTTSPTRKDYNINVTEDLVRNLPGGVIKDIVAPAAALTMSPFYDTIQGAYRGFKDPDKGILQSIKDENIGSTMIERFTGAAAPLAERVSNITSGIGDFFFPSAAAADFQGGEMLQTPAVMVDANEGFRTPTITNVQGRDLEADLGTRINPDIQPSLNMFQRAGNFIGELDLEDYIPFVGEKSLTKMLGQGVGNLFRGIAPARYGYSTDRFNRMTPGQQSYTSSLYGPGGLLQGYNQQSAFGLGALGTLGNRLTAIQNRKAPQTAASLARQQEIKDAINRTINTGESEALSNRNRSVDYGVTGGPTRTDIDVADGGAESGGGGKIVCTMMNESYGFGNFRNKIWLKHSRDLPKEYEIGYHTIFLPLVKFAKGKGKLNKVVKKTLEHIARHRTLDLKREMKGKTHTLGRVYRKILEPICLMVGKIKKAVK